MSQLEPSFFLSNIASPRASFLALGLWFLDAAVDEMWHSTEHCATGNQRVTFKCVENSASYSDHPMRFFHSFFFYGGILTWGKCISGYYSFILISGRWLILTTIPWNIDRKKPNFVIIPLVSDIFQTEINPMIKEYAKQQRFINP